MRYAVLLLIALLCSGHPQPGAAQGTPQQGGEPAGEIRGVVLSTETGQPIRAATIAVRGPADSAVVAGAITSDDGSFRTEGLRPGRYTVRVVALGFEAVDRIGVVITAGTRQAELGEIRLMPAAVEIDGVTVIGERRQVTLGADRNTYRVDEMPVTAGGNAVDVLRNVPAVQVDGENRVSLRGDQNVAVQINGQASPLRGEQLGNFLAQLPAEVVERVEVISSPSAKYDPEGMAGILNIVLDQDVELGFSGGLSASAGTKGQLNGSANLGYQAGPLTLFGSYGFMRMERESSGFNNIEYFSSATFAEQAISGAQEPQSHTLTANAALKVGEQGALAANLIVAPRGADLKNLNVLRELDGDRNLTGTSSNLMNGESDNLSLDYALSYKHAFQPYTNELTAALRFNRETRNQLDRFNRQAIKTDGIAGSPPALETNAIDVLHTEWTVQSDWTRMFGDRTRLETGYKGILRRIDDDLAIARFSYDRNNYLPDPAQSNHFEHDENIQAVYGVLSHSLNRFEVHAGLRLEQSATQFHVANTGETFDNDVGSFFPSALVAFNPDDERQLKLGYSKRIQRPNTEMLNPVGFTLDPLSVSRGNPYLTPEYAHAFELGYQQSFDSGSLQLTPFYRHTVDAVRTLRSIDEEGVSTISYANVGTSDSYGADLTASVRLGPVSGFGGLSAYEQVIDATNLSTDLSYRALGWSAQLNATVLINRTLTAQGFLMYCAPTTAEQGRIYSTTISNAAISQRLLDGRATVTLRVMNPVKAIAFRSEINDPHFFQETERRFDSRGVNLTFNYTFGRPHARPEGGQGHGG